MVIYLIYIVIYLICPRCEIVLIKLYIVINTWYSVYTQTHYICRQNAIIAYTCSL